MAQDLVKRDDTAPAPASGSGDVIKGMIAAIVLGAGGGAAFGFFAMPDAAPAKEIAVAAPVEDAKEKAPPASGRFPNDAQEISIPSIIVDLKGEPKARVRLDASIVAVHGTAESGPLKGEVREDIIAYLKGLDVDDIQGVRGFQNLREQLDDRAKIRGRGAVLGLLIGGLVIE